MTWDMQVLNSAVRIRQESLANPIIIITTVGPEGPSPANTRWVLPTAPLWWDILIRMSFIFTCCCAKDVTDSHPPHSTSCWGPDKNLSYSIAGRGNCCQAMIMDWSFIGMIDVEHVIVLFSFLGLFLLCPFTTQFTRGWLQKLQNE